MSERSNARGILMNRDVMTLADIGQFTQSSFQYGTARSMAMAGAMTSLGGDGSVMMINPAGLGMYRVNDISLTPVVMAQRFENQGGGSYGDRGSNTLALSNFSAAFNIYESESKRLISLNLGIGYNRISDFNYSYSLKSQGQSSSIANLFSRQLTGEGVTLEDLYKKSSYEWASSVPTNLWGAALGYKSGLTFQSYGDAGSYDPDELEQPESSPSGEPIWRASWISDGALVDQYMTVESEGAIGEYDLSIGGNIKNKLYFGFTFGIQSVYQRLDLLYGEEYFSDGTTPNNGVGRELLTSGYSQAIITSGAGLNLKFGATYRPVEQLRVGVAFHTPTWYSLNRTYQASVSSTLREEGESGYYSELHDSPVLEDEGENKWHLRSPSRLLIGASCIVAKRGLISVDYQRDWYGSLSMGELPTGVGAELYSDLGSIYQSVNTLKLGGEFKLTPQFALRGGYAFSSSMLRDGVTQAELWDIPACDKVRFISAGVGYSPSQAWSFDLTYMNQRSTYSSYTLFYGVGDVADYDEYVSAKSAQSESFKTTIYQHNIALSLVIRM